MDTLTAPETIVTPKRQLTLLDSTCLITGIIVGVGIYQVAPDVAKGSGTVTILLLLWLAGGLLSFCGALGYAELAAAYPREGGDYVYLTRAYGPWAGFLFGWIQLAIVRPGDIAAMAFAFATYAEVIFGPFHYSRQVFAGSAVVVFTIINILGVKQGKWTQNLLTIAKVCGLLAIVAVAMFTTKSITPIPQTGFVPPLSLALIFVLFTYGGWNEMAYVAAEVVNPARNILRSLVLGTVSVTALYLLVNLAFLHTLGFTGLTQSQSVAVDVVAARFPRVAGNLIGALICVSALGAVNGLIFAGARISYAVGTDYRLFGWLGAWNPKTQSPARSLALQGLIALILIAALGSFDTTLIYTASAVYLFYLATSLAVIVLRDKEPTTPRPYRVWGYPIPTIIFIDACAFLIYSAVVYKPWVALTALSILVLGLPLYFYGCRREAAERRRGFPVVQNDERRSES